MSHYVWAHEIKRLNSKFRFGYWFQCYLASLFSILINNFTKIFTLNKIPNFFIIETFEFNLKVIQSERDEGADIKLFNKFPREIYVTKILESISAFCPRYILSTPREFWCLQIYCDILKVITCDSLYLIFRALLLNVMATADHPM